MREFAFLLILLLIFVGAAPYIILTFAIVFIIVISFFIWKSIHKQKRPKIPSLVLQISRLLDDSYDLLCTTANPETFRSRLFFSMDKLAELKAMSGSASKDASAVYNHYYPLLTGDNLLMLMQQCRKRYYDKAVSELKTASGIKKRMQKFDAIIGVPSSPAPDACTPSVSPQISTPASHQYITDGGVTFHTDGTPITDDEIPYLIELGREHAREVEKNSPNPKFHRTETEKDLSFKFSEQYSDKVAMAEISIYDKVQAASGAYVRWSKSASVKEINQEIALLDEAITAYEDFKKFCYSKGEGGKIFFDDRWEYCHNSKNPCFSYIQSTLDKKAFLLRRMAEIQH